MAIYTDWAGAAQGTPAARAVARYNALIQQLADRALQPGFDPAGWDELGEVVRIADFVRYGNFMEVQDWSTYVDMLHRWGSVTKFSSAFRRMTETDGIVFLELQENNGGHVINSLSVYEVDDGGKIFRLHIYLQMPQVAAGAEAAD